MKVKIGDLTMDINNIYFCCVALNNGYLSSNSIELFIRGYMSQIKKSTVAGAVGTLATTGAAVSTATTVIGGSAATIMSATAGTTGAALASMAGASGLAGGAAISSGMATIGSVVGGGMAAGAVITAAAPFAAIAAIGYGLFKFFED